MYGQVNRRNDVGAELNSHSHKLSNRVFTSLSTSQISHHPLNITHQNHEVYIILYIHPAGGTPYYKIK